jgi:hypothetical protein
MIGLDGKAIFPRSYRREGGICLDIPFYRTVLSEGGFGSHCRSAVWRPLTDEKEIALPETQTGASAARSGSFQDSRLKYSRFARIPTILSIRDFQTPELLSRGSGVRIPPGAPHTITYSGSLNVAGRVWTCDKIRIHFRSNCEVHETILHRLVNLRLCVVRTSYFILRRTPGL